MGIDAGTGEKYAGNCGLIHIVIVVIVTNDVTEASRSSVAVWLLGPFRVVRSGADGRSRLRVKKCGRSSLTSSSPRFLSKMTQSAPSYCRMAVPMT